ncbi:MAG: DUF362 domain-containing protein [Patescibacteria group bacterium]
MFEKTAEFVSSLKKIKFVLVIPLLVLISASVFIYQKFFGGSIQEFSDNEFIVGNSSQKKQPEKGVNVKEQARKQEMVAVAYADEPAEGVREVVERTGNLDFIQPGQKVLVKPNVNSDDPAPGTTHPEALAEVVRLAKERGAYVVVGDRSNPRWQTIPAMKKTGMYRATEDAGADEIVGFENEDWIRVKPEKAENWPRGFRVPARLAQFDHVISVPVLHTHSITGHSLAIKNLVGLIHPDDRMVFHASSNLGKMIAEIGLAVRPSLTVIEGTKAFIAGGPSHGTLATPKVYLASKDILAADVLGAKFLEKHGAEFERSSPWESVQIQHAFSLGLGNFSREQLEKENKRLTL